MNKKYKHVMKKLAVATAVVTLGWLTLSAQPVSLANGGSGAPLGLTTVHVDLMILGQGNSSTNGASTAFHFKQGRIDDNDILGLINSEFGTSFSVTNGDSLAVSNFWVGQFMVLGQDGKVLLANASFNSNGDHYVLALSSTNTVFAGSSTTNSGTKISASDGFLQYRSGDGTESFGLEGFTTVNDVYYHNFSNSVESFQLSDGIGSASFPTNGVSGVLTGSVLGSGNDNAPAP